MKISNSKILKFFKATEDSKQEFLKLVLMKSGKTVREISKKLDWTYGSTWSKINGKRKFKFPEFEQLLVLLRPDNEDFKVLKLGGD